VKSGEVASAKQFHGVEIDGLISPFLELGIGFNPELSGRDNVYLNATVLGMTKKQIDAKFDDIVAFSELERFIDQKLKNYSSGMQVRLAFSVSIHANREILLMDEVLAVGDTNFQSKCLTEFNRYKKMGKTVILVSHDIETIRRYCDQVILIRNGKIKKIGNANDVVDEYMQENIENEEERIKNKNKKEGIKKNKFEDENVIDEEGRRFNRKIAEIVEMKIFNNVGEEKNVFKNGDELKIKIIINFKEDVLDPIFGLIIKDSGGKPLFITNTYFKRVDTGIFGKGNKEIDFILENVFSNGTYSISPAVADSDAKIYFDWKNDMKTFVVFNDYASNGVVDFKHKIIIKK
jgi:ABC-type multidrug transport system ATPase subunit